MTRCIRQYAGLKTAHWQPDTLFRGMPESFLVELLILKTKFFSSVEWLTHIAFGYHAAHDDLLKLADLYVNKRPTCKYHILHEVGKR